MTELPTAVLGRTGLEVTRLGYGAGHRKPMTEEENRAMVRRVVDSGINLIDTANDYGNSEEMIGLAISDRYSEVTVSTKCGCSPRGHSWSRDNLFRGLDESLERLKTDRIDIMQTHGGSVQDFEQNGTVEALVEMREQGLVNWIGVSTNLPHLPTFIEWGVFDIFQLPYSALDRTHEEWITKAAESGAGILIRGGVALGEPGVGKGSSSEWHAFEDAGLDELREDGESRTAFVLRFVTSLPSAHCNLVGTTNPAHLRENIDAMLRGPLPDDVYAEAKRRIDSVGVSPSPV
ncbi:MAG: aldo/keto reductase [Dehalococcoidia bacterium]|nr:aldo/keto reductase [Dehalococcoidia bacterium]